MKVLLLTQWYPPEPAKLISELAESLQLLGHSVEVLTGFPNYPRGVLYPGYRLRLMQREMIEGIRVIRVPLYPDHSPSAIKRILNYLSFSLSAAVVGLFATQRPDVILVYGSPYTAAISAIVHRWFRRVPFVFYVVDLWPESLEGTGMLQNRTANALVRFFARQIYRRAARVVAVSPGFGLRILDEGVPAEKVAVIPTWVDVDHYAPRPRDEAIRDRFGIHGAFTILFAGNIGPAQGIETVIDAAVLLRSLPEIEIVIAGDGISLPAVQEKARDLGADNVRFLGALPPSDMPALFGSVDALLVHLKRNPMWEISIPHKIFAYMASGKPIVAAVAGDAAEIVASAHAGVICDPGDAQALADAVRALALTSEKERTALGESGRSAAVTQFNRGRIVGLLGGVLDDAVRAATAGK